MQMLNWSNYLGFEASKQGQTYLESFSTNTGKTIGDKFPVATAAEIETALKKATMAFRMYYRIPVGKRAAFLKDIGAEIIRQRNELVERAHLETGLPEKRLQGELDRTVFQLNFFADFIQKHKHLALVEDAANPQRLPVPKPSLYKKNIPIGPVAIFGASNFPFAFSTAGGDTAAALAAGCTVIVKAHPSHLGTNALVSTCILAAAKKNSLPDGVFSSLIGEAELGKTLVTHASVKAVGFTGSQVAGIALYKAAINERKEPIPVFAEMSSINPILVLPKILERNVEDLAEKISTSITLGSGQFCTNPGLLLVIDDVRSQAFIEKLTLNMKVSATGPMLSENICDSYYRKRLALQNLNGVETLLSGNDLSENFVGSPALYQTTAPDFIATPQMQEEVFGPTSLIVICQDITALMAVASSLHGQLTATVFAEKEELEKYSEVMKVLITKAGRIVYNNVPTGVEVSEAMVHGGPFPAATFANSTSVGGDAIFRFLRPVCLQNFPEELTNTLL